ncbi:MAG TPA: sulfatase-like hydrolase/transferase [Polyangiaceae bacterium]|nr:sulfatase-like hydrolase/transferase [Polyangiaceae bacterium]
MRLSRPNLRQTLLFLASWALFDVVLNLRYPGEEPPLWYLLPSVDVVLMFGYFVLFANAGRKVPPLARGALVVWLFVVRALRIGDGLQEAFFGQPFHFASDVALLPELARFLYSTLPWWKLGLSVVLGLCAVSALAYALYRGLDYAEDYLREPSHRLVALGVAALAFSLTYAIGRPPGFGRLFWKGFAASSGVRLKSELEFSFNVLNGRARFASTIDATQRQLERAPHDLKKLGGRNVLLFLVESYGETVFRRPSFVSATRELYDGFEAELGARGFSMATAVLASSTYGGRSWLANATLSTGVKTSGQLEFSLVLAKKPKAIAKFFEAAGYRTVLVQPGTTRPWPKGAFYGFDQRYYAWDFDYAGPAFGWATMPDQYVIDFVHRREVSAHPSSLFVQFVLVSSHAPWSVQPQLVPDWSTLQNGALFNQLEPVKYPIEWPKFQNAGDAYIRSIDYDLVLLEQYLRDNVKDDSLVIILGDHQPVADVNDHSESRGVPVHVLCRDEELLRSFYARGYRRGMRPGPPQARLPGLETFLPNFLVDFSSAPVGG